MQEVVTISWETVVSIVAPLVGSGVWVVKWIVSRSDKDREELLRRMDADRITADEDRKTLRESLNALKSAVQTAASNSERDEDRLSQMVSTQQRIVWAQERILALLETDLRIARSKEQDVPADHR
jgi:hypothetical protein